MRKRILFATILSCHILSPYALAVGGNGSEEMEIDSHSNLHMLADVIEESHEENPRVYKQISHGAYEEINLWITPFMNEYKLPLGQNAQEAREHAWDYFHYIHDNDRFNPSLKLSALRGIAKLASKHNILRDKRSAVEHITSLFQNIEQQVWPREYVDKMKWNHTLIDFALCYEKIFIEHFGNEEYLQKALNIYQECYKKIKVKSHILTQIRILLKNKEFIPEKIENKGEHINNLFNILEENHMVSRSPVPQRPKISYNIPSDRPYKGLNQRQEEYAKLWDQFLREYAVESYHSPIPQAFSISDEENEVFLEERFSLDQQGMQSTDSETPEELDLQGQLKKTLEQKSLPKNYQELTEKYTQEELQNFYTNQELKNLLECQSWDQGMPPEMRLQGLRNLAVYTQGLEEEFFNIDEELYFLNGIVSNLCEALEKYKNNCVANVLKEVLISTIDILDYFENKKSAAEWPKKDKRKAHKQVGNTIDLLLKDPQKNLSEAEEQRLIRFIECN